MDLSIVIVNYKSRTKLISCLASVGPAEARLRREIIVVDNDSGDDLSGLKTEFPEINLILSPKNLGMGGGNNLGISHASGQYILILNPDTIIRPGAIAVLVSYLEAHASIAMVGPKLLYPDGSLQYSCLRWPSFFTPLLRRTFLGAYFPAAVDSFVMKDFDHQSIRPVDWLMGSCLLFRREIVGRDSRSFRPFFDERYFMYFEDIDLARQIWSCGHEVVYVPEAVVVHDHTRGSAQHPWYLAVFLDRLAWRHIDSWLKYFIKWGFKRKLKI